MRSSRSVEGFVGNQIGFLSHCKTQQSKEKQYDFHPGRKERKQRQNRKSAISEEQAER
jgi:hypothetical protein